MCTPGQQLKLGEPRKFDLYPWSYIFANLCVLICMWVCMGLFMWKQELHWTRKCRILRKLGRSRVESPWTHLSRTTFALFIQSHANNWNFLISGDISYPFSEHSLNILNIKHNHFCCLKATDGSISAKTGLISLLVSNCHSGSVNYQVIGEGRKAALAPPAPQPITW